MGKKRGGIKRKLRKKKAKKVASVDYLTAIQEDGWSLVDKNEFNKKFFFHLHLEPEEYATIHREPLSLVQLFERFIPQSVIQQVLENLEQDTWILPAIPSGRVIPKIKYIYRVLAAQIYIIGCGGVIPENNPQRRDIRRSMDEAREFFKQNCEPGKNNQFPGENIWKAIRADFHFGRDLFDVISTNFQSILINLGEVVAGDEKLFYFTGNSAYLKYVPSKPDRVGLWNYELCVLLDEDCPFLVHTTMSLSSSKLGIQEPVTAIVEKWIEVIKSFQDTDPILFIDSYYHTKGVRDRLVQEEVRYVAASKENNFQTITAVLNDRVYSIGQFAATWKESTKELFVLYYAPDERLGRTFVATTAYEKIERKPRKDEIQHVPAFDLYSCGFNFCDLFNRGLRENTFPHKCGGHGRAGQSGQEHKYMMAVILRNIFSAYDVIHHDDPLPPDNMQRCFQLSRELYMRSFKV